jgi:hypothetical protein
MTSILRIEEKVKQEVSMIILLAAASAGLLFNSEHAGDMSLRKVGLSSSCMALQPKRLYSS